MNIPRSKAILLISRSVECDLLDYLPRETATFMLSPHFTGGTVDSSLSIYCIPSNFSDSSRMTSDPCTISVQDRSNSKYRLYTNSSKSTGQGECSNGCCNLQSGNTRGDAKGIRQDPKNPSESWRNGDADEQTKEASPVITFHAEEPDELSHGEPTDSTTGTFTHSAIRESSFRILSARRMSTNVS